MSTVAVPDTLRQTLLSRHDKCPYSAMLYMELDGGADSHQLTRGSVFHLVRQRCVETIVAQGEQTIPGEMATELADALMAEHLEWCLPTDEQDVVRLCAYNWAESYVHDPEAFIGVEIPMQIELGGVTVTGTIDHAEAQKSTLYLTDAKTSLAIKKPDEMRRVFQGQLYALLMMFGTHRETGMPMGTGLHDVWFYEEYPRYRTDEGGIVKREASWTRAEIHEFKVSLERNLLAFEASAETGDWPARDGSWCSTCPAPSRCPIPAELRVVMPIESEEEAAEAFSKKLALEREGRKIQTGLREHVKATEQPIRVGDLIFDGQKQEVREIKDWPLLMRAIQAASDHGTPFELINHVDIRTQVKFGKRKATEEELQDAE